MQDLVRVCVADSAEQARIRQGALQRVILADERLVELLEGCVEDFEPAAVVCAERVFAAHGVQ